MHSYITPQENGNRCDVRWLSLTAAGRPGVQFVGAEPLSVSVWNCTQESLDKARHSNEVEPLADALTVNIDRTQTGVGGTDLGVGPAFGSVPAAGETLRLPVHDHPLLQRQTSQRPQPVQEQ